MNRIVFQKKPAKIQGFCHLQKLETIRSTTIKSFYRSTTKIEREMKITREEFQGSSQFC